MDYIFGVVERNGVTVENLKTVGQTHTNLEGFTQTVREYTDSTITDRFRVTEKYRSEEDAEGNCYDWYLIDQHYRYVDKTPPIVTTQTRIDAQTEKLRAGILYVADMTGVNLEEV